MVKFKRSILIVPGAVVANTDIAIPEGSMEELTNVWHVALAAATVTARTMVAKGTAAPGAGEAALQADGVNVRLGDNTLATDFLICIGTAEEDTLKID